MGEVGIMVPRSNYLVLPTQLWQNMGVCTPALTNEITITNTGIQAVCVCVFKTS